MNASGPDTGRWTRAMLLLGVCVALAGGRAHAGDAPPNVRLLTGPSAGVIEGGHAMLEAVPRGPQPGFQGFGLGYHLGFGHGGQALGVGPHGGYPFYGGPGYPHPAPRLRRLGGINPFQYHGGPGGPTACAPNFYAPTGPLVSNPQAVEIAPGAGQPSYESDYGAYSGTLPYPESTFAPHAGEPARNGPRPAGITPSR